MSDAPIATNFAGIAGHGILPLCSACFAQFVLSRRTARESSKVLHESPPAFEGLVCEICDVIGKAVDRP